jgi:hypothetical protein
VTPTDEDLRAGRLDRPPPESGYIALPESFGRRFTVFCDTEEEFDWSKPRSRDNRSTAHMASMPDLQARFLRRGIKCVHLVDHPVATDPASTAMLRGWLERDEISIGAQLHPWVNPPHEEEVNTFNSFVGNLPVALERSKIENLTGAIESAFGLRPIVYRAGRYGVGPNTAGLLRASGYEADVSVRALHDYSDEGGPDFSRVKPLPFRVGEGGLVELPLSAAYVGPLRAAGRPLYAAAGRLPHARGILYRTKLLNRAALTPEGVPLGEALAAARALIDDGVRWFSLSFHSPSVEPGNTPFVRTPDDLRDFHAWWDGMFNFFEREGIAPASIEETIVAARAGG